MANRREFLKISLVAAAGLAASGKGLAATVPEGFPKGLIYTKDQPGKWAKKVRTHAPVVKVEGKKVTIRTLHPMTAEHYIVRHTLVTAEGKVLGEKTFKPVDKMAQSEFQLPKGKGKFFASSFCNKHDFWVTVFTV